VARHAADLPCAWAAPRGVGGQGRGCRRLSADRPRPRSGDGTVVACCYGGVTTWTGADYSETCADPCSGRPIDSRAASRTPYGKL
jgi:hypothetical protein